MQTARQPRGQLQDDDDGHDLAGARGLPRVTLHPQVIYMYIYNIVCVCERERKVFPESLSTLK